jgi:hypothetical protein
LGGAESQPQIVKPFHHVIAASSPLTANDPSGSRLHIQSNGSEAQAVSSAPATPGLDRLRQE